MKAKLEILAYIQEAYTSYQQSKLNRTSSCKQEGLSVAQFAYWKGYPAEKATPTAMIY